MHFKLLYSPEPYFNMTWHLKGEFLVTTLKTFPENQFLWENVSNKVNI